MLVIIFHWFFTCHLVARVTSSLIWSLSRLLMCCGPEAYKKPCDLLDCWVQEQNHYPACNYDFQSLSFEFAPSLPYFFFCSPLWHPNLCALRCVSPGVCVSSHWLLFLAFRALNWTQLCHHPNGVYRGEWESVTRSEKMMSTTTAKTWTKKGTDEKWGAESTEQKDKRWEAARKIGRDLKIL